MEEKKNNKTTLILIGAVVLVLLSVLGTVLVMNELNKGKKPEVEETLYLEEKEITNSEVKELFDTLLNDFDEGVPNFNNENYQKLDLLLNSKFLNYKKMTDSEFDKYKKVLEEERGGVIDDEYVEKINLLDSIKNVFNLELSLDDVNNALLEVESCPKLEYYDKDEIFVVSVACGGIYFGVNKSFVYNYEEKNDEVIVDSLYYLVYADSEEEKIANTSELHLLEGDEFKITENELNNYKKVEYVFKKNSSGTYYIDSMRMI